MSRPSNPASLLKQMIQAEDVFGLKLDITGGLPTREFFPGARHQMLIDRIRAALPHKVTLECGCRCTLG
jgi:hypothetical protein